jgi:hypothetical protein
MRAVPRPWELYPGICLTTEENALLPIFFHYSSWVIFKTYAYTCTCKGAGEGESGHINVSGSCVINRLALSNGPNVVGSVSLFPTVIRGQRRYTEVVL